ncbi:MAG TPA: DUF4339 domain-containing protein [Candidatus Limnocylindrales bacterium]|jgi:hypothetical protein|nr:DUF4339 domain-containing protein [Candidatus Limnocylindrales bacterium]
MSWFYALESQRIGPVTDSQLDELVRSGKIGPATLVWREGMADWQPLNVTRPLPPPVPGALAGNTCAECGRTFPPQDVIRLHNAWVCAQCKPVFLQRLTEGAPLSSVISLWRDKKRVVTRSETTFPDRCIKCNAPANGFRLKRVIYWQHPAYYLLLLLNLLILIIVVLIVRKKAIVHIGLCEAHRARRKLGLFIGYGSLLGGVLVMIGGAVFDSGKMALAGLLLLLVGGILGAIIASTINAAKIDKEYVWITGCNRDFLANLPEWDAQNRG